MFVHFGRMEIKKESNNSLTGSYIAKFMAYAILSLYNALCNTSYTNTDDIQIYTILRMLDSEAA